MPVHYLAKVVAIGTAAPSFHKAPKIYLDCGTKPDKDSCRSFAPPCVLSKALSLRKKLTRASSVLAAGHHLVFRIFETGSPTIIIDVT